MKINLERTLILSTIRLIGLGLKSKLKYSYIFSSDSGLNKRVIYKTVNSEKKYREASNPAKDNADHVNNLVVLQNAKNSMQLDAIMIKLWKLTIRSDKIESFLRLINKNEFVTFWACIRMGLFLLDDNFLYGWSEDHESEWLNNAAFYTQNNKNSNSHILNNAMLKTKFHFGYPEFRNYWLFMFKSSSKSLDINKINSYLRAIYMLLTQENDYKAHSLPKRLNPKGSKKKLRSKPPKHKSLEELILAYCEDRKSRVTQKQLDKNKVYLLRFETKISELVTGKHNVSSSNKIKQKLANEPKHKDKGTLCILNLYR